jgi:hypothetical protein
VQAVVEGAAEAQARYMEGTLPASGLAEACGDAAGDAQAQADRMIDYRTAAISGVKILDVTWTLDTCRVEGTGDRVRVLASERWTYEAELICASGGVHPSTWVEAYPGELYVLVRADGGWRILSWIIGPAETAQWWRCP